MKQWIYLFLLLHTVGFMGGCKANTQPSAPLSASHADTYCYPVRIHSFSTEETSVTIVFDRDKTLLIDCSHNRDAKLITSYLRAQGVTKLDYVLLPFMPEGDPYSNIEEGEIYAVGASEGNIKPVLPDISFRLSESTLRFAVSADGTISAVLHYVGSPISFPLKVQEETAAAPESTSVIIQKPSPDGVQTEITFVPLWEMLEKNLSG